LIYGITLDPVDKRIQHFTKADQRQTKGRKETTGCFCLFLFKPAGHLSHTGRAMCCEGRGINAGKERKKGVSRRPT
jgi:hypothetical protein